jgi:hypothetical protein
LLHQAAKSAHEDQVKAQKQKDLEDAEAAQWADGAKESKVRKFKPHAFLEICEILRLMIITLFSG